jgi:PKD repeat protein
MLSDSSPCIDAGHPAAYWYDAALLNDPTLARYPAYGTVRNDMGAYGGKRALSIDPDFDGVLDINDNCPDLSNGLQRDADNDAFGDGCDNCPEIYNVWQIDDNGDGIGDVCPHAVVSASALIGPAPFEVQFFGVSDLAVDSWSWEFGDGDGIAEQSPLHSYLNPGLYNVNMTVNSGVESYTPFKPRYIAVTADTLIAEQISGSIGSTVTVDIYANNTQDIERITLPLSWSGELDMSLVSFTTLGTRAEYFERVVQSHFNPFSNQVTFDMIPDFGGGAEPLAPGSGAILRLEFTVSGSAAPGDNAVVTIEQYGTRALVFSSVPGSYTPESVDGGVTGFVCGDTDGSGAVTVADVTFLIQYIFAAGPSSEPLVTSDVDASGSVTIADAIYLIQHMFSGAPAPVCSQ